MQSGSTKAPRTLRIEVIGPFSLPNGLERWKVLAFSEHGTLIDSHDAYSEKHALELKDELPKILSNSNI